MSNPKEQRANPKKLAFKLAKVSVLIAFLLGFILSSLQVYLDYQKQGESVDVMVAKILSVAQRPATTSVHLLSKDLANEVVSGLLEYDFIQEAKITDDLNLELAKNTHSKNSSDAGRMSDWLGDASKVYSIPLHPPSVSKDTPGHLKVIIDLNQAYASFYDRAIIVFLSGFIRNIVLTLLLIWIFYHIITKPLEIITEQFTKREPSEPGDVPIALPKGHEDDEFASLVSKVNDFLSASRNHIQQLHQKNVELEKTYNIIEDKESTVISTKTLMYRFGKKILVYCFKKSRNLEMKILSAFDTI